ncbi:hypothetical protein CALCODRAFT_338904 [Calocera cornea HHB12733]|uniref:Uncharacterized protein n=1 Tax=Calocera cornea HHB12733 TaxID=1353952 RepID=A0A165EYN4_9BASI|nr:hypothetical protein CALCODRAFT_338904 [Calocera cornea HHB12733]
MHLTKEERDLPTTYVREALSAMQSRMGTYVHPYPRGTGPLPPSPAHTHTSMMHVDRSPTQPTHAISPVYSHSHSPAHQRYPEHSTYVRTEQPTSRPIPLTASPTSIKRPHDLDMEMPRPHSVRRTSSSSSDSTMEPATPPMPLQAPMRKEYVPRMPEERGFQVSSVRGTL